MIKLETRRFFAAASVILRYPERELVDSLMGISLNIKYFDSGAGEVLNKLISHFNSNSLLDLQMDYVKTFDRKNRTSLYLSYYLNGDTRRRGMALLEFKGRYATEGWKVASNELDDFLPILLEFIAVTSSPLGLELLSAHKAGVSLLHFALKDNNSPYACLIQEILVRIPGDDRKLTLNLIESGPPVEMVGVSEQASSTFPYSPVGVQCQS